MEKDSLAILTRVGNREDLGFDKNDFLKENFSVDEFLHKNRGAPSLEQLRDNLGLYLKGLRAAMIDLINEDYTDFINLSANLEGLDKNVDCIQEPVQQAADDIQSIKAALSEQISQIKLELEQKKKVQLLRRNLESLKKVYIICEQLKNLMALEPPANEFELGLQLERSAIQVQQLQFHAKFAEEFLSPDLKAEQLELIGTVHKNLRQLFVNSLKESNKQNLECLERALSIYSTLDDKQIAEQVFREDIVAPYMSGIINEQSLQNCPQGLAGIYGRVLNFISLHMTDLLRLTLYTDKFVGFNFLVNSFWAEVAHCLMEHLSSIFAPGNAEIFFAKYSCTRDFLMKIEELLANKKELKEFQKHPTTLCFQQRWNLPVYFQICFHDIAFDFETVLEPLLDEHKILLSAADADQFLLLPLQQAHKAMQRCWSEGVYLPEIFPKFFKLNMQIFTRLTHYIIDLIQHVSDTQTTVRMGKLTLLSILYADIQNLAHKLQPLKGHILEVLPKDKTTNEILEAIADMFEDFKEKLKDAQTSICKSLIEILLQESACVEQLRLVNDLPRLYRKTNREVPTRCSNYIEQLLKPIKTFANSYEKYLGKHQVEALLIELCSRISSDYLIAVTDVLTSVQKTEESLRRLRNLKTSSNATPSGVVTDDDKIRLQLRVDVRTWMAELEKLNLSAQKVAKLQELHNIVEDSIKTKDAN